MCVFMCMSAYVHLFIYTYTVYVETTTQHLKYFMANPSISCCILFVSIYVYVHFTFFQSLNIRCVTSGRFFFCSVSEILTKKEKKTYVLILLSKVNLGQAIPWPYVLDNFYFIWTPYSFWVSLIHMTGKDVFGCVHVSILTLLEG